MLINNMHITNLPNIKSLHPLYPLPRPIMLPHPQTDDNPNKSKLRQAGVEKRKHDFAKQELDKTDNKLNRIEQQDVLYNEEMPNSIYYWDLT